MDSASTELKRTPSKKIIPVLKSIGPAPQPARTRTPLRPVAITSVREMMQSDRAEMCREGAD